MSERPVATRDKEIVNKLSDTHTISMVRAKIEEVSRLMNGQRHVNQQMKNVLASAAKLCKSIENDAKTISKGATETKSTQTAPIIVAKNQAKRSRASTEGGLITENQA